MVAQVSVASSKPKLKIDSIENMELDPQVDMYSML